MVTKIQTLLRNLPQPFMYGKSSNAGMEFKPTIPQRIDEQKLWSQISSTFALDVYQVKELWHSYQTFHHNNNYATRLGERKTLCVEEAFVLYIIMTQFRPPTLIEIGTQFGKSTRRLIDIKDWQKLDTEIICFDLVDEVQYFSPDEANLILKDITYSIQENILAKYQPGIIFLDARPYYLLKNVIENVLQNSDWILTIHDCGKGLCNLQMELHKNDLAVTSQTGVWERHVLAEVLSVNNPLSDKLDYIHTAAHRIRIFETPHGLATILPLQKLQEEYTN